MEGGQRQRQRGEAAGPAAAAQAQAHSPAPATHLPALPPVLGAAARCTRYANPKTIHPSTTIIIHAAMGPGKDGRTRLRTAAAAHAAACTHPTLIPRGCRPFFDIAPACCTAHHIKPVHWESEPFGSLRHELGSSQGLWFFHR